MKRPSILNGVLAAMAIAAGSWPTLWTVSAVQPWPGAVRTTLALAQLAYVAYLLRVRGGRVGAPTLAAANCVLAILVWWAEWPVASTATALAGLVWLNRSLLFQRAPSAVALDGSLTLAGLLFAGWLPQPHPSLAAPLWAFFLVQSAWVLIPPRGLPFASPDSPTDPFVAGRRQAEAALERLR